MTVKEIAEFTEKNDTTVTRWIKKAIMQNAELKKHYADFGSYGHDYNIEEVEHILRASSISEAAISALIKTQKESLDKKDQAATWSTQGFPTYESENFPVTTRISENVSVSNSKNEFMTVKELASTLGVSEKTVKNIAEAKGVEINFHPFETAGGTQRTLAVNKAQATVIKIALQNQSKVAKNGFVTTEISNELEALLLQKKLDEYRDRRIAELTQENERQAALLIEQKPKVEYYDHYMDSKNNFEIEKLGKDSGIGARRIFKFLEADRVIRAKYVDGVKYYESYAYYDRYFQSVMIPFTLPTGEQYSRPKLMLTPEGMSYFMKKYKSVAA